MWTNGGQMCKLLIESTNRNHLSYKKTQCPRFARLNEWCIEYSLSFLDPERCHKYYIYVADWNRKSDSRWIYSETWSVFFISLLFIPTLHVHYALLSSVCLKQWQAVCWSGIPTEYMLSPASKLMASVLPKPLIQNLLLQYVFSL